MILTLVMIAVAAVYRVLPHPLNLAPLGAMALLGGLYFGRRMALVAPLAVLFVTDLILNVQAGYAALYWPRLCDYGVFALIGLLGLWARNRHLGWKLGSGVATPFVFYTLSNFGVWVWGLSLAGQPYAKTWNGLVECYVAGLPFLRGTVAGDWVFLALFGGLILLARNSKQPVLGRMATASVF